MTLRDWGIWSASLVLLVLIALALTSCGTVQPKVVYQPVNVPVSVSCVPAALGPKPDVATPAALAAIPDGPSRFIAVTAAYLALFARALEAEPVIAACRN